MIGIGDRIAAPTEQIAQALEQAVYDLRVATPGIIVSFDPLAQTAVVQPAIRENVLQRQQKNSGVIPVYIRKPMTLPELVHVPVVYPRGGGYIMSFPINPGDECLIVFGDRCIDGWWQSGGVQNQMDRRAHDLSDGFAIVGPWSQKTVPGNISQSSVQLRSEDGSTYFDVIAGQVTSKGSNLLNPSAANTTFTDGVGRIYTVVGGTVQNAEGFLQGLINANFFTQGISSVNACNSIADLQRVVNDLMGGMQGITSDITSQIAALSTLPTSIVDLPDVIGWITAFMAFVTGPITNLAIQLTSLTTSLTTLAAAATTRATQLGGSVTIPPF